MSKQIEDYRFWLSERIRVAKKNSFTSYVQGLESCKMEFDARFPVYKHTSWLKRVLCVWTKSRIFFQSIIFAISSLLICCINYTTFGEAIVRFLFIFCFDFVIMTIVLKILDNQLKEN